MVTIDGKPLTTEYSGELWRFKFSYDDTLLTVKDDSKPYKIKDESIPLVIQGAGTYNTKYYSTYDLCVVEYVKAKLRRTREVVRSIKDTIKSERSKIESSIVDSFIITNEEEAKKIDFLIDTIEKIGLLESTTDSLIKAINKAVR